MQEITDIENCIHNKVKILCTKIDSLTAENKAQESAHREEIFKLNDKCVVMCRAKQEEIDRLTARNKELNFCIENLIKRREEFDKNVAKLTTENKKLNQILDERAAKGMEAMGFERAELRQDAGTEFTKNWKEKRQLFADLKPVGDELDYMQVVCKHIHELLMMGDKACSIIDCLTAENKVKDNIIRKLLDKVKHNANAGSWWNDQSVYDLVNEIESELKQLKH